MEVIYEWSATMRLKTSIMSGMIGVGGAAARSVYLIISGAIEFSSVYWGWVVETVFLYGGLLTFLIALYKKQRKPE